MSIIPSTIAEMNVTLIEDSDIVNTDIICLGNECNHNIYNGEVYVEGGQNTTINNNMYYEKYIKKGSDFSMYELVDRMNYNFISYIYNKNVNDNNILKFFQILDMIFVSHMEYYTTQNNVEYMANEFDRLNAEVMLIKQHLNITLNLELVECQAGINKAKRTGQIVHTEHNYTIDINTFGEECIKIN